jgi:hypothetical protein
MGVACPPPPCRDLDLYAMVLHVALRPLYELRVDLHVLYAIARRLLIRGFLCPYIEGLLCRGRCYGYKMVFKCMENGKEKFAEVEIIDRDDYGLDVSVYIVDKLVKHSLDDMKPRKIVLRVEEVEDEEIKKIVEELTIQ